LSEIVQRGSHVSGECVLANHSREADRNAKSVQFTPGVSHRTAQTHPQCADLDQFSRAKSNLVWQIRNEVNAQMSGNCN
jgi:hypothetical protein